MKEEVKVCSVLKCSNMAWSRGMCQAHYQMWHKYGEACPPHLAHRVGRRTLLAKTCTNCGEFLPADQFQLYDGYRMPQCRKHSGASFTGYDPVRAKEQYERYQGETLPVADRHRCRWTQDEDNLVMDEGLTMMEKAAMLGRSYKAVDDRIWALRKRKEEM